MTHQLNLYDVENDTNYTLLLDREDYNRALIDQAFAQALLAHAKCNDSAPKITDNNNKTDELATESAEMEETNINEGEERTTWTKDEILQLINIYKENEHRYKSTTIRKETFWSEVASKIGTKTAEQARSKFKNLKTMYMKKKDNMSSKATGRKKVQFSYFEEMDSIFARHPNVTPVAIASSSAVSPEKVLEEVEQTNEEVKEVKKPKDKKYKIPEQLKELKVLLTEREDNASQGEFGKKR